MCLQLNRFIFDVISFTREIIIYNFILGLDSLFERS